MTSEHKPSILIVDDDETYRNRLARAFVDRGYDVRTAHDHDSALAAATSESPEFAVVESVGGTLTIDSRSGGGTTVSVILPTEIDTEAEVPGAVVSTAT